MLQLLGVLQEEEQARRIPRDGGDAGGAGARTDRDNTPGQAEGPG